MKTKKQKPNYKQLVKEVFAEYPESRTDNEKLYWLLCDRKLGLPFTTKLLKAFDMIAKGELPKIETILRLARQIKAEGKPKKKAQPKVAKEKEVETIPLADVRNKLSPVKNLVAMMETSFYDYHHNPKVNKLIKKEMKQVKKNVDYLSSGGKNKKNK